MQRKKSVSLVQWEGNDRSAIEQKYLVNETQKEILCFNISYLLLWLSDHFMQKAVI